MRSFRLQDADALDVVQTTWLRLAQNAHRVQEPESLGGWLVTTTRRECLRILAQIKAAPQPIDVTQETVADPSVDSEQRVINADTARTLRKVVTNLSSRRRTVVLIAPKLLPVQPPPSDQR